MTERDGMAERQTQRLPRLPATGSSQARVWVLDDPHQPGQPALAIAERLEVPFRRVKVGWRALAQLAGSARGGARRPLLPRGVARPLLVLSSGARAAAMALLLKRRLGCRLVHCTAPRLGGLWTGAMHRADCDLLVLSGVVPAAATDRALAVLGSPQRIGPAALHQAAGQWAERLDHLPHPRVALLLGGPARGADLEPARAHGLARAVARMVGGAGGSVMASTSARTGREASDAVAAGLGQVMHLLHRHGEPGENPYAGFLAMADAVIVAGDSPEMLAEACAIEGAVFAALPELAGAAHRRLLAALVEAGQVRPLQGDLSPWPRKPLDEAGRVATEIRRRFALE